SPASRTAPLSFLFNLPAPTEIYTLSLHDALPIYRRVARRRRRETDWSAIHADSVWIAGAAREPDFHRASGHETERNASRAGGLGDRKSTRLNSSHDQISYAVFCLKKKKSITTRPM